MKKYQVWKISIEIITYIIVHNQLFNTFYIVFWISIIKKFIKIILIFKRSFWMIFVHIIVLYFREEAGATWYKEGGSGYLLLCCQKSGHTIGHSWVSRDKKKNNRKDWNCSECFFSSPASICRGEGLISRLDNKTIFPEHPVSIANQSLFKRFGIFV